jgi:UDP-N-acetylmuramate dehydrogenase
MKKNEIAKTLSDIAGPENIMIDEPMKKHTSIRCGGPADILATPQNSQTLFKIVQMCRAKNIPFFIMGNGTNIIVRGKGIRGVVIKLAENFSDYSVKGNIIEAQAGILISKISKIALDNELTGIEFAEGIPGTLGGAVTMNAGAYDGEMSKVVVRTHYLDKQGVLKILEGKQHEFGKRTSFIQRDGGIVLKSEVLLKKGNKDEIKALMGYFGNQRKEKQPLEMPSAGSIFKRPEGNFAGKLIQDCGLKGLKIGGAAVSCKHCGFIVNSDNAASDDIIRLIAYIQRKVKEQFGIELQTEVRIVGEE